MLDIFAIPAFTDNYIWALRDPAGRCWIVDPGDAAPVRSWLAEHDATLVGILITHHHWDHTGGLKDLLVEHDVPVYGPDNPRIRGLTRTVADGDEVELAPFGLKLRAMAVPGHTLDHIAYYGEGLLFCGDTLFSCGCGRLFEGTPEQLHHSLESLAALPGDTRVYCAHEYTLANMAFAQHVDPDNHRLREAREAAVARRERHQPTLPSDLARERALNPFLRCDDPAIVATLRRETGLQDTDPVTVFATLRRLKDNF